MKRILEDSKNLKGKVLCIGVDDERLLHLLSKNKEADVYTITRTFNKRSFFRNKNEKLNDGKKVNMKKIKKSFKKKSIDYIICNLNEIEDYFKYFIGNSVVINKRILYLYGTSATIDPKLLAKRFKRYKASVEVISDGDDFTLIINNESSKTNWIRDKWYFIADTFHDMGDAISSSLAS